MSEPLTEQQILICNARDLLRPSPVKPGIPTWVLNVIRKSYDRYDLRNPMPTADWADHRGTTEYRGDKQAFVCEPYGFGHDWLHEVEDFATKCGCAYAIDPNSWWFPGRTIRIAFYRK